ncbi:MAG: helix-turn-helix transcriptional regulator [Armatimonadetes bacterium]|nr:helix-turn-helix transcriptional regulator [Armatimonadota bacterium]
MATQSVASVQTKEYDELLKLLRETREAAEVSQEGLSKSLGRARTYIGKIEAGTRRVDVIEVITIAKELGLEPATFLDTLLKRVEQL